MTVSVTGIASTLCSYLWLKSRYIPERYRIWFDRIGVGGDLYFHLFGFPGFPEDAEPVLVRFRSGYF